MTVYGGLSPVKIDVNIVPPPHKKQEISDEWQNYADEWLIFQDELRAQSHTLHRKKNGALMGSRSST